MRTKWNKPRKDQGIKLVYGKCHVKIGYKGTMDHSKPLVHSAVIRITISVVE